ncbi:helix-hairpin-helix domain-containing protein [Bacillus shivajii]|uniref:helix-hairpin-helix domain-containing protein n=1 Tax=Bacillus shivajii TaxID=1983719 RepID=UPI001CF9CEF2|nr:helix-hairpin-helix domain-containing protein [Bacillus shivajii]UCZ54466.1 helix-hairpin-helix domain-containing protein [Bacillus shivajii]
MKFKEIDRKWYPFIVGGVIFFVLCLSFLFFNDNEPEVVDAEDWLFLTEGEENEEHHDDEVELEEIVVDVKGEVRSPGVYTIQYGERVYDVILLAGGFTDNANENVINLAEKCYDEMVIYVPSMEEELEGINHHLSGADDSSKVRINRASKEELTNLPGIGPAKAEAIITYREEHGPFEQVEDLSQVSGIGQRTVEQLREHVSIR